jgi:predicted regulator of Ras-like GTPase activity (Roadblock/LC7/MglB family)
VDQTELEQVEEVIEEMPPPPQGTGMSLEEQMRQMEAGAMAPPAGGMSLEEQMRQMEAGAMAPPAEAGSLEEQMRRLEGGGMETTAPAVPPKDAYDIAEPVEFEEYLRQLVMEIPGGIAGSIAGYDGIGIASFSTDPDFPTTIADAELASIMGAMKKAAENLSGGEPHEAYFLTERLGFVVKSIRSQYFVTLVVEVSELNWGLTRLNLQKITPLIESELF